MTFVDHKQFIVVWEDVETDASATQSLAKVRTCAPEIFISNMKYFEHQGRSVAEKPDLLLHSWSFVPGDADTDHNRKKVTTYV